MTEVYLCHAFLVKQLRTATPRQAPTARGYGCACSEGEAWDRGDIVLCGQQAAILEAARNASRAPLVTVMINGGTISASWIKQHSAAVLESWYPGQAGGEAVAAVVWGDRAPSGRLPVTIYDEGFIQDTSRNITNMTLRGGLGVTYMFYRGVPLWPFGFGLAYTSWRLEVRQAQLSASTSSLQSAWQSYYQPDGLTSSTSQSVLAVLDATIHNTGNHTSDVVVHVYARLTSRLPSGALAPPRRQLAAFARATSLSPGGHRVISVRLAPLAFCRVDENGSQWAEASTWVLDTTVDGVEMVRTALAIEGPRRQVMSWPDS
jgi:hypothetical protein